jgi:tetratricopeptide (TPR) repeat protein
MKARQLYMHFTKEALDEAMGLIERARALVGDNPLVLATMAHIHWNYHNIGVAGSDDSPRLARELSARALELDPDQPLALTVQASLAMRHDGHRVAIGLLERVVAVEPAVDALMWLTTFSIEIGQEARARHWVARAIAVDPLSPLPRFLSGWVDMHVGRFDAALRCVTPLGDDHPADFFLQFFTAVVEIHAGADETAKARFTRIAEADAQMWSVLSRMYLAALAGRRDEVVQLTSAESFAGLAKVDHQYSYFAAECLTECGEHDAALQWLANAIGLGMTNDEFFARHNRFLAPLRGDPRFEALMERARTAR